MALSRKEKYRLNMDALYGTDMSQDRLINERHHAKRKIVYNTIAIMLTMSMIAGIAIMVVLSFRGVRLAIGTKMDGSTFFGFITMNEIEAELEKDSVEELTYNNLEVIEPLTDGIAIIIFIYLILGIIVMDRRAESVKALKAKEEYDRRAQILEKESLEKQAKFTNETHKNAPDIIEDDLNEE